MEFLTVPLWLSNVCANVILLNYHPQHPLVVTVASGLDESCFTACHPFIVVYSPRENFY